MSLHLLLILRTPCLDIKEHNKPREPDTVLPKELVLPKVRLMLLEMKTGILIP